MYRDRYRSCSNLEPEYSRLSFNFDNKFVEQRTGELCSWSSTAFSCSWLRRRTFLKRARNLTLSFSNVVMVSVLIDITFRIAQNNK